MALTENGDTYNYLQGTEERTAELVAAVMVSPSGNAGQIAGATLTPLGYGQDTTISSASALPTVPAATTVALIQAEGADIRWRDDATNPTASVGMLLAEGTAFWYRGTFSAFKAIQVSSGGVLNVAYYQEVAE